MSTGSCLCGAVRFAIAGPLGPPEACHCSMCRRQSGHVWAATEVARADLTCTDEAALSWYAASPGARRAHCRTCGSFLFWAARDSDRIEVAMGALDRPTGLRLAGDLHLEDRGDYHGPGARPSAAGDGAVHRGACLCGAVQVEVTGPLPPPDACHCSQCRRQSGHVWASTDVPRGRLSLAGQENLTWYASSARVRRGFCRTCGSVLFWDVPGRDRLAVAMGCFEAPTHTALERHIFVADKGDYYEIDDGLPQHPR